MAASTKMENVYYMGAKRPWQPRQAPQGMFPNQNMQFPMNDQMYAQNSWNIPMPWQHGNQQKNQWRPSQQYSQSYHPYPQSYPPYSQPYTEKSSIYTSTQS